MPDLRVFVYEFLSGGGAGDDLTAVDMHLLAQGTAMRDAIVGDLARLRHVFVTCAGVDRSANLPRRVSAVSPDARESAAAFVRKQAAKHDWVWIVAPETDAILASLRDAVGDGQWIGCSREAIRIAGSKRATRECLHRSGVAATRDAGACPSELRPGTRVVVKPDDGAGACETRVHATLDEALDDCSARRVRGRECVAEIWEDGAHLSLSLLCESARARVLSVNRQRIEVGTDGAVSYAGVDVDVHDHDTSEDAFASVARSVAKAVPGLRGYVGIDCVLRDDGTVVVIEINPRATCSYVGLSAALGYNVGAEVLRLHERMFEHAQP